MCNITNTYEDFFCYHWTQTRHFKSRLLLKRSKCLCSVIVEKFLVHISDVSHVCLSLNLKCIYIFMTDHKTIQTYQRYIKLWSKITTIHFKCYAVHWIWVLLNVNGLYRNCDDLSNAAGHHIVMIHSFIWHFTITKLTKPISTYINSVSKYGFD